MGPTEAEEVFDGDLWSGQSPSDNDEFNLALNEIDPEQADEWYCENPIDVEAECTRIRQMLEQREQVLGPMHPSTLGTMRSLAGFLEHLGNIAEATALYKLLLNADVALYGSDSSEVAEDARKLRELPSILSAMHTWADFLEEAGDVVEAAATYRRLVDGYEAVYGADSSQVGAARVQLEHLLGKQG